MSEKDRPPFNRNQLASQRNLLAFQRNLLAIERTFLAYLRTGLAFSGVGLTLISFFGDEAIYLILGWIFIPLGLLIILVGGQRSLRARRLGKILCDGHLRHTRPLMGMKARDDDSFDSQRAGDSGD